LFAGIHTARGFNSDVLQTWVCVNLGLQGTPDLITTLFEALTLAADLDADRGNPHLGGRSRLSQG
jgi:hypothetical protein